MQATTKPEITATAIYKVTLKDTGKTCWAVPSDSQQGVYYSVCFEAPAMWTCSCPAGTHGYSNCKHRRAVRDSIQVNKANPVNTELEAEVRRAEMFLGLWERFDIRSSAQQAARRNAYTIEFGIY